MPSNTDSAAKASGVPVSKANRRRFLKVAGLTALAGCAGQSGDGGSAGSSGGSSGDWPDYSGESIHFITRDPLQENNPFYKGVASDFKDATGAEVRVEHVSAGGEFSQRISQLLQSGTPPHVCSVGDTNAQTYMQNDLLAPISDVVDTVAERYGEPTAHVFGDDEKYSLPTYLNLVTFWYRQDLADVKPDSYEKVVEYAEQAGQSDEVQYGSYACAGTGSHMEAMAASWGTWNGAQIFERGSNGDIQVSLHKSDRDRWIETFELHRNRHQFSPNATDSSWGALINAIPTGQVASSVYMGTRPKNAASRQELDFATDVKPTNPWGRGENTYMGMDSNVVFDTDKNEIAKTFLKFLYQDEYVFDLYLRHSPLQNIPPYPDLAKHSEYRDGLKELPLISGYTDSDLEFCLENQPPLGTTMITRTNPPNPYASLADEMQLFSGITQKVIVDGVDPATAIDNAGSKLANNLEEARQE